METASGNLEQKLICCKDLGDKKKAWKTLVNTERSLTSLQILEVSKTWVRVFHDLA